MSEKEEQVRNLAKNSGEKRANDDLSNSITKKPKLNEINVKTEKKDNIFEALSSNSVVKSNSQTSVNPAFVPVPTTRLEDILSADSISTPNKPFSRNFQAFAYSNKENDNADQMDDDEALAQILRSRKSQRKLYTGRRANANGVQVPKLFDLASRCLSENLDDLHLSISSYSNFCEYLKKKMFLLIFEYFSRFKKSVPRCY